MAFTLVHHPTQSIPSGTSTSLTITAPTAGNGVFVLIGLNGTGQTINTPTLTNCVFTALSPSESSTDSSQTARIFGCIAGASAGTSVSISWSATNTGSLVVAEFSGFTGSPITQDGNAQFSDNNTNANVTTPSITPTVTGDLLLNFATVNAATSGAAGGWTAGDTNLAGTGDGWAWATGTLSTLAADITISGGTGYGSTIVAVQASSGTASTGPTFVPNRMPLGA